MDHEFIKQADGQVIVKVKQTDFSLIQNPLLNKGMAFSATEREAFNLWGLLPPSQVDLTLQRKRSLAACISKSSPVEKYIYLRDLQDSNETLFYSLLTENIETLLPIVYTPTVGLGCQRYSHIYRRPRGVFISWPNREHIDRILANPHFDQVKVIVVSDGERILGLGDQGAGGMGIPIGKLALYSACAGIYPGYTLPVLLDTGTDNPDLLNDPLYIGWQHPRIRGAAYDEFIDTFISAVKRRFPHVLVQWEDFARQNAGPLLDRYRDRICSFNDDIQGTAAVATGALLATKHITGVSLQDQCVVIVGAGSAGCGIASFIRQAMRQEGLSAEEIHQRLYLVDQQGLLMTDDTDLPDFQQPFAHPRSRVAGWQLVQAGRVSLIDVIRHVKPSVLIGVSGQPGTFTEEIVRTMAASVQRPVIFPLSNPDSRAEAVPADLLYWTGGRVIISTGSPFSPVFHQGRIFPIDQTNNCYIFPGLGLALVALKAKKVTDGIFMRAAYALADLSPAKMDPSASLLPSLRDIREVSFQVALAVAKEILNEGLAGIAPPEDLVAHLRAQIWEPVYLPYQKA